VRFPVIHLSFAAVVLPTLLFAIGCRRGTFPDYPAGYREFAYVANSGSNTVSVLDLVFLRTDRTVSVGANPVALAASPTRDEVYVLSAQPQQATGALAVIDTRSNAVVATIPLQRNPQALVLDPAGNLAYVANASSNSISVVDLSRRRTVVSVPTSASPGDIMLSPDGRTLVVPLPSIGSVAIFSATVPVVPQPSTLHPHPAALATADPGLTPRATFYGCPGATSPVILPDSSKAFIACPGGNQVLVLSLAEPASTWAAQQDSTLIKDHLVDLLDTGHGPTHLTMKPDGGEIFVSNSASDSVSEIATATNEVGSTYPIGNSPTQGLVSADNSALWIADSGADSLSLYSISDGKLVSSVRTGMSPVALAFSADEHLLLAADKTSGDVAVIRTTSRLGPALFTLLPSGSAPVAIVVKAMQPNH
jgi:YVTN family beta-propeller protein